MQPVKWGLIRSLELPSGPCCEGLWCGSVTSLSGWSDREVSLTDTMKSPSSREMLHCFLYSRVMFCDVSALCCLNLDTLSLHVKQ